MTYVGRGVLRPIGEGWLSGPSEWLGVRGVRDG